VPEAKVFGSGRHFAAWIGIAPREHSTGGRQQLGRISKQGDEDLRRRLVLGATAVIQQAKPGRASPWLLGLLARKPKEGGGAGAGQQNGADHLGDDDQRRGLPVPQGGGLSRLET
jgi:Transposase IS116/IS110/IS902 family